jgi:hypothetical protein
MSNVTDLLVTCGLGDDHAFGRVQQWFCNNIGVAHLVRVDGLVEGTKAAQAIVGIAAVNGWAVVEAEFLSFVEHIAWRFPDMVHVFVNRESSDFGFGEIRLWVPAPRRTQ